MRILLPGVLAVLLPAAGEGQVVQYYHLDAGGSVRAVTDAQSQLVERHDYLPFGEEWCGTTVCATPAAGQPRRFAGKEQDAETGLHYFGARYYRGGLGRFSSPDPAQRWREAVPDPQKWNRYAYALNNPLRYADADGRWPSKVVNLHQRAIDVALDFLPEHDRTVLKWQQQYADEPANQVTEASYKHAMAGNDATHRQTPEQARQLANDYIRAELERAQLLESLGVHSAALEHVGNVIHLLQDATSPAHERFQSWDGTTFDLRVPAHILREFVITPARAGELLGATRKAWEYFASARELPQDFFQDQR